MYKDGEMLFNFGDEILDLTTNVAGSITKEFYCSELPYNIKIENLIIIAEDSMDEIVTYISTPLTIEGFWVNGFLTKAITVGTNNFNINLTYTTNKLTISVAVVNVDQ